MNNTIFSNPNLHGLRRPQNQRSEMWVHISEKYKTFKDTKNFWSENRLATLHWLSFVTTMIHFTVSLHAFLLLCFPFCIELPQMVKVSFFFLNIITHHSTFPLGENNKVILKVSLESKQYLSLVHSLYCNYFQFQCSWDGTIKGFH